MTIRISKPVSEVFSFVLNPKNTPLWLDSIVVEKTNEWPVRIGTIYRNKNKKGKWSEYRITGFKKDNFFEFSSTDSSYHVKYTFRPINQTSHELEYYEWMDEGELKEPFTLEILKKLKSAIESCWPS